MNQPPVLLDLQQLPNLAELFKRLNSGKHLNRLADASLWLELETCADSYHALFAALGYELRIDSRGFAWFHSDGAIVNTATRQQALLWLLVFEYQSDAGKQLARFSDWIIDQAILASIHEKYADLLRAESLDYESLQGLLDNAVRLGFACLASGGWQPLPAVHRYLDHFSELKQHLDRRGRFELPDEPDLPPDQEGPVDDTEGGD